MTGNGTYVVWPFNFNSEIYVYYKDDNGEVTETIPTSPSALNYAPRINERGEIVWVGKESAPVDYEIFFYDIYKGLNRRITTNNRSDVSPEININGYVTWKSTYPTYNPSSYEIFLDYGISSQISSGSGYIGGGPLINSKGMVGWIRQQTSTDWGIYLKIPPNSLWSSTISDGLGSPRLNANGDIVWLRNIYNKFKVYLYNGTATSQLVCECYTHDHPDINDIGTVVWSALGGPCLTDEIFINNNGTTTRLTDAYDDYSGNQYPSISASGVVVWSGVKVSENDKEILVYDGTGITNLTESFTDTYSDDYPTINANGDVAWQRYNSSTSKYELWLATRTGDIEVSPLALDFGGTNTGSFEDAYITVTNTGSNNRHINTVTSPSSPFSLPVGGDGCSGTTISPSNSCTVAVRFSPTQETAYASYINISSDSTETPIISVTLSGRGDNTPPTGSVSIENGATYTNSTSVDLTLSASDSNDILSMCISNSPTCSSWEDYSTSKIWSLTSGDGDKTVYAWFEDDAGNISQQYSDTIILDWTPPSDGSFFAVAGNGEASLSWAGFSDGLSGINSYKIVYSTTAYPNTTCSNGNQIYSGNGNSFTHSNLANGTTFYYRICAVDNTGNISAGRTAAVTPSLTPVWTDNPIISQSTFIKAIHIIELRYYINKLRGRQPNPLSPYAWTDDVITPGVTEVKADHINQLQTALKEKFDDLNFNPVQSLQRIDASHINDLRTAVNGKW